MAGIEKFTGGIVFGVSMATQKLAKDVSSARKMIGGMVGSITKQIFSLKGALVGLGSAIVAGKFANMIKEQFKAVDALGDTAQALNVTSAALAGLGHAADQSGSSQEQIERGLAKLVKSTSDAANGLGTMSQTYKTLGLDAKEMNQLSPDQQFLKMADAISKLTNKQDQLSATQRIFGRGASSLVGVLRLGSAGLAEMQAEASALGIAIDEKSVRGIQRAMDAFQRFRGAVGGIFRSIAAEIAPLIEGMSDKLASFLAAGEKGKSVGKAIGGMILEVVKTAADAIQSAASVLAQMAHEGIRMFIEFRRSFIGQKMGMTPVELGSPIFGAARKAQEIAEKLANPNNMPSVLMEKAFTGMRAKSITETTEKAASGMSGEKLMDLAGQIGKAIGPSVQRGMATVQLEGGRLFRNLGLDSVLSGSKRLAGQVGKSLMGDGEKLKQGNRGFALTETGSAAAFQQRVRGEQQNTDKIAIEQRDLLKAIAKNTANPPQLQPAGLKT